MSTITLPYDEPHSHPPKDPDSDPDPDPDDDADQGTPGVLLTDHLADVGSRAEQLARRGEDDTIADVARIAGELHDFGKVMPYFQHYIDGNPPTPASLKNHSSLGSFAVYHVLSEMGYDDELALVGLIAVAKHHGVLPNVVEYVNDTGLGEERQGQLAQQVKNIHQATDETANEIIRRASGEATDWPAFRDALAAGQLQTAIKERVTSQKGQLDAYACSPAFYDRVMQIWGTLVIADKTSAAGVDTDAFDATHKNSSAVSDHIDELQDEAEAEAGPEGIPPELKELNDQRDQARESIVANGRALAREHGTDGWVGKITLPTGLGKTLAALQVAHAIGEERGKPARIIYALPYTSIIDQTATVIEDTFEIDTTTTNELTIHHHLEEVVTELEHYVKEREEGRRDTDEYAEEGYLAAKGWNDGMVLTTFVQLFESLVRPTNQQAMKLPALYDSVIILDEPQTLPLDWWRLIRRLVETLVEDFNATVISMTATQPRILTEGICPFAVHELVDEPDQYFELVERVEYQYHPSFEAYLDDPEDEDAEITHEEAGETVIANLSAEEPTGLAVCNTVASAVATTSAIDNAADAAGYERIALGKVYAPLAQRNDATFEREVDKNGEKETLVESRARELLTALETTIDETPGEALVTLHLTTRHRPIDRKVLLEAASQLSAAREVPFVFVATQLVEAGVDVSFTRVYRDFAPISSVVQAAGRCNRSAERDRGVVTIWRLEETPGAHCPPSELVYGHGEYNKLGPTARALDEVAPPREGPSSRTVREMAVAREGVEEYYRILDEERDVGTQEFVDWVDTGQFGELRELSLIDERPAFDVLVCRSKEEHDRAVELLEALSEGETATAYDRLSALEETQVSLPESEVRGELPIDAQPAVFGGRLVFVVDDYAGEGNFLPRTGLRG